MQTQRAAMLEACYEAVASLAVRRPELFSGETSVPRLLFSELSAKEPSLRVKISAALGALKVNLGVNSVTRTHKNAMALSYEPIRVARSGQYT